MTRFGQHRLGAAALLGAAAIGGGAGAAIFAATSGSGAPAAVQPAPATPVVNTTGSQLSVSQIYAQNAKGVVEVDVTGVANQPFPYGRGQSQAQGTGFVYDNKGNIITNQHVVAGATSISVKLADGSTYTATLVGADPSTDLAVIRIDAPASELHPLTLGDSSTVAIGAGVVAIGDPFGLDNSVTSGIVSALGREITAPDNSPINNAIQTDAAINHGNSGGPLFDMQGHVIGVISQIQSDTGGSVGVGFAIPSNTVRSIVTQLVGAGKAQHALVGVVVQTIPGSLAGKLGLPAGAAIARVETGTAAAGAGLKAGTGTKKAGGRSYPTGGDVITALDGTKVASAAQLHGLIDARKPGDTVQLTVVRNGSSRTVKVTLGARP
jgi:putative serine protease PepD